MAHGSGFLAVYLASMVLGNAKLPHWPATRGFAEGLGWIAQIGMFVLLGLLVTPHELGDDIWPALVIGLVLTMVARPAERRSSACCRSGCPGRSRPCMSWAGLRGAVPIILATIPMVNGVDGQPPDLQHRLRPGRRLHPRPGPDPALAGPASCGSASDPRAPPTWASSRRPWSGCAAICCPSRSPRVPDARRRGRRAAAARGRRRHAGRPRRNSPSCRCRRRCCGAATNCSWWPPTRCGTRPRRGCARSARAASWPDWLGTGRDGGRAAGTSEQAWAPERRGRRSGRCRAGRARGSRTLRERG